MRLTFLASLLLMTTGLCAAQDSNFSTGPQYLMNFGSPLFLQPISTPSLSLSAALAPAPVATAEASAESVSTSPGTQAQADLRRIYWGEQNNVSAGENVSEIELSSQQPSELPASILNVGVAQSINGQGLEMRGYGMTLGQVAARWKARKNHPPRLYTNADIARLHGS